MKGQSALFLAAQLGHHHAAALLIEANADINALSDDKQSPLIAASAEGHREVLELLREHGASEDHLW